MAAVRGWSTRRLTSLAFVSAFVPSAICAVSARDLSPQEQRALHLRELEITSEELLAKTRRNCAMHLMTKIKKDMEGQGAPMPDVHVYCIKAMEVSARRGLLADLYVNLALQEQGHSEFHFAGQTELLKNNESSRTRLSIFKAADAGEPTYTSITGKVRQLPCPLAFDAGYTWAYRNPDKSQPYELTAAVVETIARSCYDPSVKEIMLSGASVPAQKAGLFAGAWLGRQQRTNAVR